VTRAPVPSRLRLRRRLLMVSTPVTVAALAVAIKLISVVVVGGSAQEHFAASEIGSLRTDVAILRIVNVIEPANAAFAAGGLGVLDDQLEVADAEFSESLAHTDSAHSCAVRVNLELVRERQADIDAWEARLDTARQRYHSALAVIADAPARCFEGNGDPDASRRAVRQDAAARVAAKISALGTAAPPPLMPSSPPPADIAAPVAPVITAPEPTESPGSRQLDPTDGDPLDVLRRVLRDAAAG
jgi:hypothetical protein